MQESTVDILVRSQKGESRGQAHLRMTTREEAWRKAMIAWLGCWGLALLTLPIPIVHFIAPPILLLVGPAAGFGIYKLYSGAVDVTRAAALCPDCGANIAFGPQAERWPTTIVCQGCQAYLSVTRPTA